MAKKSTPISQLRGMQQQQPYPDATDMQMRAARNAQVAAESFTHPQDSSSSSLAPPQLLVSDDDNTIKEVLSKFNGVPLAPSFSGREQPLGVSSAQQQQQQQQIAAVQTPQQQHLADAVDTAVVYGGVEDDARVKQPDAGSDDERRPIHDPSVVDRVISAYGRDAKVLLALFVVAVVAAIAPLNALVGRYFAVDRIPYSEALLKASLAAVLGLVCVKVFYN